MPEDFSTYPQSLSPPVAESNKLGMSVNGAAPSALNHKSELQVEPIPSRLQVAPLPIELKSRILGYLLDDRDALRNCALTNREMLAVSRSYLFRSVCFRDEHDVRRLIDVLDSSPVVARCVREVAVGAKLSAPYGLHAYPPGIRPFYPVLPTLTPGDNEVFIGILRRFTLMVKLSLLVCKFTVHDFVILAAAVPQLEHLVIEHCGNPWFDLLSGQMDVEPDEPEPIILPCLRTLRIDRSHFTTGWQILRCLADASEHTLRSLALYLPDRAYVEAAAEYLRSLGSTLRGLQLELSRSAGVSFADCIDLSPNSKLEALSLTDQSHQYNVILSLLSNMPKCVRKLHISSYYGGREPEELEHHGQLAQVLCNPKYTFTSVSIAYNGREGIWRDEWVNSMKAIYESLHRRGVLRFVDGLRRF